MPQSYGINLKKKEKKAFVSIRRNYSTIIVHPHHFDDYFIPIFKNIKHFWESVPLFFMATKSTVWVTNQWDQETKSGVLRVHGMVSNKASKNQFFVAINQCRTPHYLQFTSPTPIQTNKGECKT